MKKNKIAPCPECGQHFNNVFEAVDHLLEDGQPRFEVAHRLSDGFRLLLGTLMREMYANAGDPDTIRFVAEQTFMNLYFSHRAPSETKKFRDNVLVERSMKNIEKELYELLSKNPTKDQDGE